MKELIRSIFVYEFETGAFGIKPSEFTDDIIEAEVKRLTRNRKTLDFEKSKAYVFVIGQISSRLIGYKSLEEALDAATGLLGDTYVIADNFISKVGDYCINKENCYES